ncbi:MAG: ABC transporter permease [Gemmatimonadales bacterium]|nr:MAG: ABC transporter permease [Gemmatimonadales bacterium]
MEVGLEAGEDSPDGNVFLSIPRRFVESIGRTSRTVTEHAGQLGVLFWKVLSHLVHLRVSYREILNQIYVMGVQSVPIVIVTAVLAGIVTSQQGGYQFTGTIPLYVMGSIVVTSVVLELAPVLTAIVLVGRVGARITAELGTMEVSEQIDAFHSVGRDPIAAIAAPRIVAGVIVLPILTGIAIVVGIYSGLVSARLTLGIGTEAFFYGARLFWHNWDLLYSLSKATAFGLAIPLISSHMGFRTSGGAAGVGRTTTASVMFMTLTVLILDALFPPIFLD